MGGAQLSDFRGGIGQGVNAATGEEINSAGGWIELGYLASPRSRVALGYTRDDPDDADLPDGGRTENEVFYLHNRLSLGDNVDFGANYLHWTTRYKGQATGRDNRVNLFGQRNF